MSDGFLERVYANTQHYRAWFTAYFDWPGGVMIAPNYTAGDPQALGPFVMLDNLTAAHVRYALLARATPWDMPEVLRTGDPCMVSADVAPFFAVMGDLISYRPPAIVVVDDTDIYGERVMVNMVATHELIQDAALDAVEIVADSILSGLRDEAQAYGERTRRGHA